MPVRYVDEFSYPSDFGFKPVKGFAKGGSVSVKQCYGTGGKVKGASPVPNAGKVPARKETYNKNDAVSPGSPKRTPPPQSAPNKMAAKSQFSRQGKGTPPATKQTGDVPRMSAYSDFKKGGSTKPSFNRLANLGHYAHGGKVKPTKSEVPSGKATGKSTAKAQGGKKGTEKSVQAAPKMAGGGLTKAPSPMQRKAIHAKRGKQPPKPKASGGNLAAVAGALQNMQHGPGPMAPPGMAPGMGQPPAMPMGQRPMPPMAGGMPAMADGGVLRVMHHLV